MENVWVLLAEGFEEIEAITAIDILRRAELDVCIVGVTGPKVAGSHGISVDTDAVIGDVTGVPNAIVIPGGMPGAQNISNSAAAVALIKQTAQSGGLVAAICAAPAVVLAPHGLISGKRATCYPGFEGRFTDTIFSEERVVIDGNCVTSRGPGTAAEFALAIVERMKDSQTAEKLRIATLQR